jgi:tetratricopeptide (TPR) repeat protein
MSKFIHAALIAAPLVLCAGTALAQGTPKSGSADFEEGNRLMEEKLYNQAAQVWKQLVGQQPDNSNLNWKLGQTYMLSYNQKAQALPYLEVAATKRGSSYGGFNTSGYDPFDPKETNAPMEVDYWLAKAYHLDSQFDKADEYYNKFIAEAGKKNEYLPMAKRGLEETANARVLMAAPKPFAISNVGAVINSEYPDYSPVISVDGNALFFTSRRVRPDSSNLGVIDQASGLPFENIYVSYKDRKGDWQKPEAINIDPPIGHLATVNVSADGQTLFIYRDDDGDGNLYESHLVGEQWSDPVKMGSDINTEHWEPHGALTADGNTFYFVSDRPGGFGGRDIYRVVKLPNGEWSKAQNIGDSVNTKYDEDGVFIHPDGRTLYFASKGHNSMGGFDIFTTEMQDDGTWSTPVNIGYPLNTVDDDIYFVTTADGRRGYFSSDKPGGYGEKDIYFVDFPEEMGSEGLAVIKGFIIPPAGETLPANTVLYITDKSTGEVRSYRPRQRDGVYVAILPPCKNYNIDYRVNDTTVHTEDIFVECESAYQEINKEVYLNPVSLGGTANIVDLPPGAAPGSKEKGEPVPAVVPLTDEQMKEKTAAHVMPNATYDAEFSKFYDYNAMGIDTTDASWKNLIAKTVELLKKNGEVKVVVEASASHVPTKTYSTNDNLSGMRMEAARQALVGAVRAVGLDPNNLKLEALTHLVQGPQYAKDPLNTAKYGKFQYVKLKVH